MGNTETTYVSSDERVIDFDDALARAWANIRRAAKDGTDVNKRKADGSARRYTTLSAVDEAIRDALTAEGFTYPQPPSTRVDERGIWIVIHTQIRRKGVAFVPEPYALLVQGQMLKGGEAFRPPTAQDMGSALTYARRYALTSVFGVCPDEDDDGHAASHRPEPKPDPLWDAYAAARDRLMAAKRIGGPEAYDTICEAAGVSPKGEETDAELRAMTAAAERLLAEQAKPPREPKAPRNRERDQASGEQTLPDVLTQARDEWAAAGKGFCEAREADYLDAECRSPSARVKADIKASAVALSAQAAGGEWPKEPTVEQYRAAADALRAAVKPREKAPRVQWREAQRDLIDARVADYRAQEGEDPDADAQAGFLADSLRVAAKAVGLAKWPAKPTDEQWGEGAAAMLAEAAKISGAA